MADKAHFSEDLSNSGGSLLFTAFGGSICMHRYSDLRTAFEAVVSEVMESGSVEWVVCKWCTLCGL